MEKRSVAVGISIKESLLEEIDRQRRLIGIEQGKDLTRSAYIRQLLKKALDEKIKTTGGIY